MRDPIARLAASCELAPEALSTAVDAERVRLNDDGAMATFDGASAKESLNLQNNLNVNLGVHAETQWARPLFDSDRLRQVARLVHVRPFSDGDMVGQQLHRHGIDQGRNQRVCLRHLDRRQAVLAR